MQDDRRIFTLLEITQSLRSVIESKYISTYWIKAEIAKLNYYPRSGHCYPEIVEKSGNIVKAQMRCTIWASDFQHINNSFLEIVGQPLKEGITILFRASVTFNPVYGLSLNILEIEPSFTLGEMAREKIKTIERLQKEDLFERNKSTEMPLLPSNIAVISVETSKGYHDFLNILNNHPRKFAITHTLFPAILQGDRAVETISAQLRIIKNKSDKFDAVAIIRGGGGDIGLNCYDSYQMAKEVALCPIPVISGIGHSTNETITEMIAWENKITPTDVAYYLIQKFEDFYHRMDNCRKNIINIADNMVNQEETRLKHMWSIAGVHANKAIQNKFYKLSYISKDIHNHSKSILQQSKNKLKETVSNLSYNQNLHLYKYRTKLNLFSSFLPSLIFKQIEVENKKILFLDSKTKLLKPENTLKRGYTITRHNKKPAASAEFIKKGDEIETIFSKGKVESTVDKKID